MSVRHRDARAPCDGHPRTGTQEALPFTEDLARKVGERERERERGGRKNEDSGLVRGVGRGLDGWRGQREREREREI